MPINIYNEITNEQVTSIGESDWKLPSLLDSLEKWITANNSALKKAKYIADIGFDIRPDASGGGGSLSAEILRKLSDANIDIHFSEYPGMIQE